MLVSQQGGQMAHSLVTMGGQVQVLARLEIRAMHLVEDEAQKGEDVTGLVVLVHVTHIPEIGLVHLTGIPLSAAMVHSFSG